MIYQYHFMKLTAPKTTPTYLWDYMLAISINGNLHSLVNGNSISSLLYNVWFYSKIFPDQEFLDYEYYMDAKFSYYDIVYSASIEAELDRSKENVEKVTEGIVTYFVNNYPEELL